MALLPVIPIADAKTMLDGYVAWGTGCNLFIRTGAQPATTLTADSGTLLATLPMSSTPFGASTNATANGLATAAANAITSDTNAAASGTAGHFRAKTSGSVTKAQGNVGTSGTDMIFNTATIAAGDTVACTSFKATLPCGDGAS